MGSKPRGISASRGAAILGISKYKSRLDAWIEIMEEMFPGYCESIGIPAKEQSESAVLKWGLTIEPAMMAHLEIKFQISITDRERIFEIGNDTVPLTCHVDGLFEDRDGAAVIHEGKTTNVFTYRKEWGDAGTDHIPADYQVQVQHQMGVSGIAHNVVTVLAFPKFQEEMGDPTDYDLLSLVQNLDQMGYMAQYPVEFKKETFDVMKDEYAKFWIEHVLAKVPPEPTCNDDVRKLFPHPVGTVVATEDVERLSTERSQIQEEMKIAKVRLDQVSTMLLNYMRKNANVDIDANTTDRCILVNQSGKQLNSYNGKTFR